MKIAVIGAGSWGTAVSWLLNNNGHEVKLWAHGQPQADAINETGRNPRYLSDISLDGVWSSSSFAEVLDGAEAVVLVTPSVNVRETCGAIEGLLGSEVPLVVLSKGIERETGMLLTEICEEVLGNPNRIAALSGPNHAEEISLGLPAATVIASSNPDCAALLRDAFASPKFRVYTSDDVCGVEVCAASKNVIAILCGIAAGLNMGDNTASVLMTRGLAEMSRLVHAMGGNPMTCMGLAGMGDLIATCSSRHSRNRQLGEMIANGQTLEDFRAKTHMVAEGAYASLSVTDLAERHGVDVPLSRTARLILWENASVEVMEHQLMTRPPRDEFYGLQGTGCD